MRRAPPQATILESPLSTKKFIQEVRLTSAENDKVEWLVGAYYANENGTNLQEDVTTPPPPGRLFVADFPSQYKEYAGFGNLTYYLTDNLDVTGGVRVSHNVVDFDFFTDGVLTVGFGPSVSESQTTKDTVATYLANLRWRPTDDLSLYFRAASGYRGPGAKLRGN